ncbi:MAG: AmmeMemoRadiSam system protein B [Pseudothermotoga sp.]
MKHFGKPRLLSHATSADVTKDRTQAVGYASFICEPA